MKQEIGPQRPNIWCSYCRREGNMQNEYPKELEEKKVNMLRVDICIVKNPKSMYCGTCGH